MDKYRFYRTYDDGWKGHRPLKVWDHQPTVDEIHDELNKLSMKIRHEEAPYIRCWSKPDDECTFFDFGSWSVLAVVTPNIFGAYVDELRKELR